MFSGVGIIEELSPLAAVLLTTVTSPSKRGVEKSHKHLENDCPLALVKEQTVHIRLQNQLLAPDFRTSCSHQTSEPADSSTRHLEKQLSCVYCKNYIT